MIKRLPALLRQSPTRVDSCPEPGLLGLSTCLVEHPADHAEQAYFSLFTYDVAGRRSVVNAVAGRPIRSSRVSAGFYGATRHYMPCVLRETSPAPPMRSVSSSRARGWRASRQPEKPLLTGTAAAPDFPPNDREDVRRPP